MFTEQEWDQIMRAETMVLAKRLNEIAQDGTLSVNETRIARDKAYMRFKRVAVQYNKRRVNKGVQR